MSNWFVSLADNRHSVFSMLKFGILFLFCSFNFPSKFSINKMASAYLILLRFYPPNIIAFRSRGFSRIASLCRLNRFGEKTYPCFKLEPFVWHWCKMKIDQKERSCAWVIKHSNVFSLPILWLHWADLCINWTVQVSAMFLLSEDEKRYTEKQTYIWIEEDAFQKLNKVLINGQISLEIKRKVMDCYGISTLFYIWECWTISPRMGDKTRSSIECRSVEGSRKCHEPSE